MNKEAWIQHLETTENLVRPSRGGDKHDWCLKMRLHKIEKCRVCINRSRTISANANARAKNEILRDLCGTSAAAARRDMGL